MTDLALAPAPALRSRRASRTAGTVAQGLATLAVILSCTIVPDSEIRAKTFKINMIATNMVRALTRAER